MRALLQRKKSVKCSESGLSPLWRSGQPNHKGGSGQPDEKKFLLFFCVYVFEASLFRKREINQPSTAPGGAQPCSQPVHLAASLVSFSRAPVVEMEFWSVFSFLVSVKKRVSKVSKSRRLMLSVLCMYVYMCVIF